MLALVASIHVLNTTLAERRRRWPGQARPWRETRLPTLAERPPAYRNGRLRR